MLTSELDYPLPEDRIAVHPAEPRDAARLMVIHRAADQIEHRYVRDLPDILAPAPPADPAADLLILNRSRVIPAAFTGTRAATTGRVHGLYLDSPNGDTWHVMLESRGSLRVGETITLDSDSQLLLAEQVGNGRWLARLDSDAATLDLLDRIGSPPLPPYIRRRRRQIDEAELQPLDRDRYNTVYADQPGSVAAPTAGLHFTDALLAELRRRGLQIAAITLHVGPGTFTPIRTEHLDQHQMHSEWFSVPPEAMTALHTARARHGRIIPVGTTSVRTLESLPDPLPTDLATDYTATTNLFIYPASVSAAASGVPARWDSGGGGSFRGRFTDAMLTNFHLPRSTLLAMVAALPGVGIDRLKQWYRVAIEQGYRFYSYGDAMLIL